MIRPIDTSEVEAEGLCYDLPEAREHGLFERMSVNMQTANGETIELRMTDELFEAILNATDLSVNVEAGDSQFVLLGVHYVYDYGNSKNWSDDDLETIRRIKDELMAPAHP